MLTSEVTTPSVSKRPSTVFEQKLDGLHDKPASSSSSATTLSSPDETTSAIHDIAIIGYGCRVAGGNNSPDQLWDFLMDKGDASGDIPEFRWKPYDTRQPGNSAVLSRTTSKGYFLDKLEDFDAPFFGISPREAEQIDPQQRIALEVTWEALEDAGLSPQNLAGSDTAVFMGVNSDDYGKLLLEDLPNVEPWMGVGTAYCGIPNRISYLLDLQGPSTAIDTACASSLCAIHHAKQSLVSGESSLAIAGGVNALIGPGLTSVLDKAGVLSEDGRCRSFDQAAAGYGRGEGAGVVILKRFGDALNDGDRIIAVLKGSAAGANGKTNGIMAPDSRAQEIVARKALKEAGCSGQSISYVEAHATSTSLGDPTEFAALEKVYGAGARHIGSKPCYVGSIKSNIGHLEAGAGVMGFIKAAMVVNRGIVPPQANLTTPSEKLHLQNSALEPVMESKSLQPAGWPFRAAVASYGYGGSVAHAILEAPTQPPSIHHMLAKALRESRPTVLVLSAPSANRVKNAAKRLLGWLKEKKEDTDLESVAYTLAVKRSHHKFRTAILAETVNDALLSLDAISQGKPSDRVFNSRVNADADNKGPVWVFSGHGAQWTGMGRRLLQDEPIFADVFRRLESIAFEEVGFSLTESLQSGNFEASDTVQVLTYVIQVALAETLKSKGVTPVACVGHSLGEIAASVVAGAISMEAGARICFARARLYRRVAKCGAMAMISLSFLETRQKLAARPNLFAAIDSSPNSCVISGAPDAVKEFVTECQASDIEARMVKSDIAFHTPMLSDLVQPLRELLSTSIDTKEPHIPLYSTSLSDPRGKDSRGLEYWINNMIEPVMLNSAVHAILEDGYRTFVEISSHPIVTHSLKEIQMDANINDSLNLPTLLRKKDDRASLLFAVAKLHCIGTPVDFRKVLLGTWLHNVPGTIWEHRAYWKAVATDLLPEPSSHDPQSHTILGSRLQLAGTDYILWQTKLRSENKPFPGNHPLHGSEIIPAAVLVNTFLTAAPEHRLRNVSLRVPVVVDNPREIQIFLEKQQLRIASRLLSFEDVKSTDRSWLINTSTDVSAMEESYEPKVTDLSSVKARLGNQLSASFSIDYLAEVGVSEMGFPWKVVKHLEGEDEMLALVDADPTSAGKSVHFGGSSWASILDAATSISSTIFYADPLLRMPTLIDQITVSPTATPPKLTYIHVRRVSGTTAADVTICDEKGHTLIDIEKLEFAGIEGNAASTKSDPGLIHRIAWPPVQFSETPLQVSSVTFFSQEHTPQISDYESQLSRRGITTQFTSDPKALSGLYQGSIVVFLPTGAESLSTVYETSAVNCKTLLDGVKELLQSGSETKLFTITSNALNGTNASALAWSPLIGLARILQSEAAEVFGGLIDVEDSLFPWSVVRYVQDRDVVRIQDSVPRAARLRPFEKKTDPSNTSTFQVRPQGTYLITGGLGALGLEIAFFLARSGAKRLILVSRRSLPAKSSWTSCLDRPDIQSILKLESMGVSVYPMAIDMTAADANEQLQSALDNAGLPPVRGVIHAAGVLANQTVTQTTPEAFNSVIAPKIVGALALHKAFPPMTLDFFIMFSSCGQLLGFPGQAAYASGNSFLDSLATMRRNEGDNAISMLWTSWRGLGMAASTRYIDAELAARGITDVTKEEAFRAWKTIFGYETDHAVILRTLTLDANEPSPHPILDDSLTRHAPPISDSSPANASMAPEPTSDAEREVYLQQKIVESVADTLSLEASDVDPDMAMTELGMDSVMTVELRARLQKAVGLKVGPTLVWTCPTVKLLVKHFMGMKKS